MEPPTGPQVFKYLSPWIYFSGKAPQHLAGKVSPEFTVEIGLRDVDCLQVVKVDEIKVGSEWNQEQKRHLFQGRTSLQKMSEQQRGLRGASAKEEGRRRMCCKQEGVVSHLKPLKI